MKKLKHIRRWQVGIVSVSLTVVVALGFLLKDFGQEEPVTLLPVQAEPEFFWRSALDGTLVEDESKQTPGIIGIMIDNHVNARPQQTGLSQAKVVYEALAEGGITRYLALFDTADQLPKVGPIRSARPYFLDWIREYGGNPYVHVGGSPEALSLIDRLNLFAISEIAKGQYFWRDYDYYAPHNVFTNATLWNKMLAKEGAQREITDWDGWLFEDVNAQLASSTASTTVKGMTISYGYNYSVGWKYDGERYVRSINSRAHTDRGTPLFADTVIIQEMKTKVIDDVGRKDLDTIGNGEIRVLKHGEMVRGTWKKESVTDRTKFFDEAGEEIPLAAGKVWVQIVPLNTALQITT